MAYFELIDTFRHRQVKETPGMDIVHDKLNDVFISQERWVKFYDKIFGNRVGRAGDQWIFGIVVLLQ